MDIGERVRPRATGAATQQGVITPRGRLADVHEVAQHGDFAQGLVVVGGLVCVAPPQGFQLGSPCLVDPDQRVVQRHAGHVGAGLFRGGLQHVAPCGRTVHITENTFDEQRIDMIEFLRQGPKLILDQPLLQGAQPGGIDQRFRQMFVHLARPAGKQGQRALALALRRAFGRGFAGEPKLGPDQR